MSANRVCERQDVGRRDVSGPPGSSCIFANTTLGSCSKVQLDDVVLQFSAMDGDLQVISESNSTILWTTVAFSRSDDVLFDASHALAFRQQGRYLATFVVGNSSNSTILCLAPNAPFLSLVSRYNGSWTSIWNSSEPISFQLTTEQTQSAVASTVRLQSPFTAAQSDSRDLSGSNATYIALAGVFAIFLFFSALAVKRSGSSAAELTQLTNEVARDGPPPVEEEPLPLYQLEMNSASPPPKYA